MVTPRYERPRHLQEALAELAQAPYTVIAGGTDVYPAHVTRPLPRTLLDISRLSELRGVQAIDGSLRLGALLTWREIAQAALPPAARCLAQAAQEVGGVQIQSRATIGGNLCNASPAADGVPPLLALDARVELASTAGRRQLPLSEFILGNRCTACRPDELLVAIHLPPRSPAARSVFLKLGARRYLVISIAMVAVVLDFDARGHVAYCGVAVGACAARAQRLPALEAALLGAAPAQLPARAAEALAGEALAPLAPIDDVRGSAAYRLAAVRTLLTRAIEELSG